MSPDTHVRTEIHYNAESRARLNAASSSGYDMRRIPAVPTGMVTRMSFALHALRPHDPQERAIWDRRRETGTGKALCSMLSDGEALCSSGNICITMTLHTDGPRYTIVHERIDLSSITTLRELEASWIAGANPTAVHARPRAQ